MYVQKHGLCGQRMSGAVQLYTCGVSEAYVEEQGDDLVVSDAKWNLFLEAAERSVLVILSQCGVESFGVVDLFTQPAPNTCTGTCSLQMLQSAIERDSAIAKCCSWCSGKGQTRLRSNSNTGELVMDPTFMQCKARG